MSDTSITKAALAQALQDMMEKKPFNKIRISEIVAACHLERQTFYYHFEDKYALVIWIFKRDVQAFSPMQKEINFLNVVEVCEYFDQKRNFYKNIFLNGEKRILHDMLYYTFYEKCYQELSIIHGSEDMEYCEFAAAYLATGTTGSLIQWLLNENQMNLEKFSKNLYRVQSNIIANIAGVAIKKRG